MIEKNNSEIEIKFENASVRACGSEEYIDKTMEQFFTNYLPKLSTAYSTDSSNANCAVAIKGEKREIDDLFSLNEDSGKISIHGKVPGASKSERMRNVALISAYCAGTDAFLASSAIKDVCIEQACLDQKNFAASIKKDKSLFVVDGRGADWSIKLTVFGKEKARGILEEMLDEQSTN